MFREDPQYRHLREVELKHLREGLLPNEKPELMVDYIAATCRGDASVVLGRCKEVLQIVLSQDPERWSSLEEWKALLPDWFLSRFAQSAEEEATDSWALEGWTPYFQDRDGQWWWWDAEIVNPDTIRVAVTILGWPYGGGELLWLLRAAGAADADKEI